MKHSVILLLCHSDTHPFLKVVEFYLKTEEGERLSGFLFTVLIVPP